jgi:sialidase-1
MKLTPAEIVRRLLFIAMIGPLCLLAASAPAQTAEFFECDVFYDGLDGYTGFRIPAITRANNGTLLAFAGGHKTVAGEDREELVLRRSFDNGQSWSATQVVWSNGAGSAGLACPVVDQTTGDIVLVTNHQIPGVTERIIRDDLLVGARTYQVQRSSDNGATWTDPARITAIDALDPVWLAGGPNHGIQLTRGDHAGRLIISGNHSVGTDFDTNRGHIIYSDDGGVTWELGAVSNYNADIFVSETAPVELTDGSIYLSTRDQNGPSAATRAYALRHYGGESFAGPFQADPTAISPVCQGSILRYSSTDQGDSRDRIIQSYPYSGSTRENIMVRSSFDETAMWNSGRVIYEGSSAYSDLVRTADDRIGLLYERDSYSKITFAGFTTRWLDKGNDLGLYSSMDNMDLANGVLSDDYGAHDGQLMGGATQANDATRGAVLEVAALGDHATYGDAFDPLNTSYTAAFWFKITDTGSSQILASKGMNTGSGDEGWATLYSTDGHIYFRANYDGTSDNRLAVRKDFSSEDFDEWHHIAVVIDQEEGVIRAYLDGEGSGLTGDENGWDLGSYNRNTFTPGTVFDATDDLALGLGKKAVDGQFDDFAVWRRALADAEILGLYNGTLSIPFPDPVPGDTNRDYVVNEDDAAVLAANWGHTNITGGAANGDFNDDGIVNVLDAAILAANWGDYNESTGPSAVPEPTALALAILGVLMLAIRRPRGC